MTHARSSAVIWLAAIACASCSEPKPPLTPPAAPPAAPQKAIVPSAEAAHGGGAAAPPADVPVEPEPPPNLEAEDEAALSQLREMFPTARKTLNYGASPDQDPPRVRPGWVACGTATCRATQEVCCSFRRRDREAHYCLAARALAAPGIVCLSPLADAQAARVQAACDDSGDCGANGMCCHGVDGAMVEWHACEPMKTRGSNACLWNEVCHDDSACKTGGTTCRKGVCRRADPQVRCGSVVCSGATPVCCAGVTTSCAKQGEACPAESSAQLACAVPSDCGAGLRCCFGPGERGYCSGDCTNAAVLCDNDADCRDNWGGKRCVAVPGSTVGLKTCG